MSITIPLLIVIAGAGIGAAFIYRVFIRSGYAGWIGALVGAGAGALGPLIFMLPLNFCTFEAERKAVDFAFGIVLVAIGLLLALLPLRAFIRWQAARSRPESQAPVNQQGAFRGRVLPWLFLTPTLAILLLFLYYPSLDTLRLSTLLARLGARRTAFVCVDNFTSLLSDPSYGRTVLITFIIGTAVVVIGLILSLLIATMAYQPVKGARIYRTLLVWPYAISPVVAGIIFVLMFNPTGGIINYFLKGTVGISIPWLNDPNPSPFSNAAVWAVILTSVWKSMGFNILFYIAGLQNVSKELQEAAAIDGANALQRYWYVVIPSLGPITFFLVITNLTYAFFETFGTIDFLTGGGPLEVTTTMMYRVYEVGVVQNDLGKGAAQSIVLFLMVVGLTYFQFRTQERRVTYGA